MIRNMIFFLAQYIFLKFSICLPVILLIYLFLLISHNPWNLYAHSQSFMCNSKIQKALKTKEYFHNLFDIKT